jgi:hypothetical protein
MGAHPGCGHIALHAGSNNASKLPTCRIDESSCTAQSPTLALRVLFLNSFFKGQRRDVNEV